MSEPRAQYNQPAEQDDEQDAVVERIFSALELSVQCDVPCQFKPDECKLILDGFYGGTRECDELQSRLTAAEQRAAAAEQQARAMRWVPVSEGLPKTTGVYWVTLCADGLRWADRRYYSTDCGWNTMGDTITHYMPLPQPPMEGEG